MSALLAQYVHNRQIFFNTTSSGANVSTDQSNFPVLVEVSSASGWNTIDLASFFGGHNTLGKRVQFFDTDGTNLSYEVDSYDADNQIARYWVKVPTITGNSATDFIMLGFGNDPAGSDQDNMTDVWSNGYIGVFHLRALDDIDSKNNASFASYNNSAVLDPAYIGKGINYPGTTMDYSEIADTSNRYDCPTALTITNWFRWNGNADTSLKVMVAKEIEASARVAYRWRINNDEKLRFSWINGTFQTYGSNTVVAVANTWAFGAVACAQETNGATGKERVSGRFYYNGVDDGGWTGADDKIFIDNNDALRIGAGSTSGQQFRGGLDEVRIANVMRVADWIKLEYMSALLANGFNGGNLISFGPTRGAFLGPSKMFGL